MSHAWVTVTNGPFMETLNEKLAANLLCDITGFQLPFPAIDRYNMESAEVAAAGAEHLQDIDDMIAEFNRQQAAMGASPEQAVEGAVDTTKQAVEDATAAVGAQYGDSWQHSKDKDGAEPEAAGGAQAQSSHLASCIRRRSYTEVCCSLIAPYVSSHGRKMYTELCTCYDYINRSLPAGYMNQLWEYQGSVSYVSNGTATQWHGTFEHGPVEGMITVHFDCHGKEDELKMTRVMRIGAGHYTGLDYMKRVIEMRVLARYRLDNGTWIQV
jgi:hypothetical protein